ncbi:MAG: hypothetical protein JO214_13360 [Frankiaceae bacterium]|nr:hypothetical protein [Frankiaceae bacterium]
MPEPTRPMDDVRKEIVRAVRATELDAWTASRAAPISAFRSAELLRIVAERVTRRGKRHDVS